MDDKTEQKKIYNLYGLFGVSLILCVIPYVSAAIICVIFFLWLLIAAYMLRGRVDEQSLAHNHATHIIRSLWIGALISVVTTFAASFYMMGAISYDPFQPCANSIAGIGIEALEAMGFTEIYNLAEPCVDDFITFNQRPLLVAVVIAATLPLLYLAYRFFKGVSRAAKGYRLADPKSWF